MAMLAGRTVAMLVAVLTHSAHACAQDLTRQWTGESYERLGATIAVGGDIDQDDVGDFAVCGLGWSYSTGRVRIYSGATGDELLYLTDGSTDSAFGYALAFVEDWNSDGIDDIAVGAPQVDLAGNSNGRGVVRIFSGADGTEIVSFEGQASGDKFGFSLSPGDVDADGVTDLVIGAPFADLSARVDVGRVYVFSGASKVELRRHDGASKDDNFGYSLTSGDFTGDGVADYAVGAIRAGTTDAGRVRLLDGMTGTTHRFLDGTVAFESFGVSIAALDDIDLDGADEIAVLTPNHYATRRADVFSGVSGSLLYSVSQSAYLPAHVAAAGDVDFDGVGDLLIGRPANLGGVCVLSGVDGSEIATLTTNTYDYLGSAVSSASDLDGDGYVEFLVGAENDSTYQGRVDAWTLAKRPRISGVTPEFTRYKNEPVVATISGKYFLEGPIIDVRVDGTSASSITVLDDATLTCVTPDGSPGPTTIEVESTLGVGRIDAAFWFTPRVIAAGDFTPGGFVTLTYDFEFLDDIFAIVGIGPQFSTLTPPYDGELAIVPFNYLFSFSSWFGDQFIVGGNLPHDSSLIGIEVLAQALIGPELSGKQKDAAWTKAASFVIN